MEKGKISYLFQEPRLLPWKTVFGNIDFILKQFYRKKERVRIISHYLYLVGLDNFIDYYPDQLSGGMKQRTSAARAFAFPSDMLLMDEPFQALDLNLKLSLISTFKNLWMEDRRTTIFVTHDITEALLLGDRIMVMGPAPMGIKKEFYNPLPLGKRKPGDKKLLNLERELYKALLEEDIKKS